MEVFGWFKAIPDSGIALRFEDTLRAYRITRSYCGAATKQSARFSRYFSLAAEMPFFCG
jgi:hypothetical protein